MSQRVYELPIRVAEMLAEATREIRHLTAHANEEIGKIRRRQQEVLDTYFEVRGVSLPEGAQVSLDFEGEVPRVVVGNVASGADPIPASAEVPEGAALGSDADAE